LLYLAEECLLPASLAKGAEKVAEPPVMRVI
jgi:hypothetical protein